MKPESAEKFAENFLNEASSGASRVWLAKAVRARDRAMRRAGEIAALKWVLSSAYKDPVRDRLGRIGRTVVAIERIGYGPTRLRERIAKLRGKK